MIFLLLAVACDARALGIQRISFDLAPVPPASLPEALGEDARFFLMDTSGAVTVNPFADPGGMVVATGLTALPAGVGYALRLGFVDDPLDGLEHGDAADLTWVEAGPTTVLYGMDSFGNDVAEGRPLDTLRGAALTVTSDDAGTTPEDGVFLYGVAEPEDDAGGAGGHTHGV